MPNEEIQVRFSGNLDALSRAMRSGVKMGKEFAKSFGSAIKDGLSSVQGQIVGLLSFGTALRAINQLTDYVDELRRVSEGTGLNVGLVQDLMNVAKASGVAGDAVESMLDKFVKNLKPGSNPEEALKEIADQIASIEDPATRADIAVANFGKSGIKLIPILAGGSEGLKEFADQFGRLDEVDLTAIGKVDDVFDRLSAKSKVWLGHLVTGGTLVARMLGKLPAALAGEDVDPLKDAAFEMAGEAAVGALEKNNEESQKRQAQIKAKQDADHAEALKEDEKRHKNLEKAVKEMAKESERKARAEERAAKAMKESVQAAAKLATGKSDRTKFTLGELVDSAQDRIAHGSFLRGPEIQALRLARIEEQARIATFFGNGKLAGELTDKALALRKSMAGILTSSEADPLNDLKESSQKAEEHLREIKDSAKKTSDALSED